MSNFHNLSSLSGSTSNPPDGSGRTLSYQFGTLSPVFNPDGSLQGVYDIQGEYYVPNSEVTSGSRNSGVTVVPPARVQQQSGAISNERYASTNLPVNVSQMSHGGSSHGNSGITSRGSLGGSPTLVSAGSRAPISMGNMAGGRSTGRALSSEGSIEQNQMMSGVLQQQGSPQAFSMPGSSYPTAKGHSQNRVQELNSLSSISFMNDMNSNDTSQFDINNDFPQLTSRPSSAAGHGQMGARMKQGFGVSPMYQLNQEFNIQNEDFPALPGYKGSNADYPMDLHHKELMMQSQQSTMGRPGGFNFGGASSSHNPQPQQHAQAVSSGGISSNGSDIFSSLYPSYNSQTGGPPSTGLRSMNAAMGYDQPLQHHQNTSQYRKISPIGQPFRDMGPKPMQATQSNPDPFSMLGLLGVINKSNPDLTTLALGIDLTKLGLDMESTGDLFKTFASPWANEPLKVDYEVTAPQCYNAKQHPPPHQGMFRKFLLDTLFYIFYSMPKDEAQLYAANELYNRNWFYHKEHKCWFTRNGEPLVKTDAYERGTYDCFDPNTFEIIHKENAVIYYEMVEQRPFLPQHRV